MLTLLVLGLVAGVITSLSPCVLPVLPVVLSAAVPVGARAGSGETTVEDAPAETPRRRRWRPESWRPYGVVAGLVLSFSLATLFGALVLKALHLPSDLLRNIGIVVLVVIGLGFIIPRLGELLERPFARLPGRNVNPESNGIVLGIGLGLLFVPCAGPVLAVIAVVGASGQVSFGAVLLTAGFALGVGLPLLVLALAGDKLIRRTAALRRQAPRLRVAGGVVMIAMAVLIAFNLTDGLQRLVPGYTSALEKRVEAGGSVQLRNLAPNGGLKVNPRGGPGCSEENAALVDCGPAPEPKGIVEWLNTPDGKPVTLAQLRGKVVLVDFWTYSCINCQRTLPHLESWYTTYKDAGLQIIGVHSPEFIFERVAANVKDQAKALGVQYPIALDNNFATWREYNATWPSEFLIDKNGNVRHVSLEEGHYATTEALIRQLLTDAKPGVALPAATDVPDVTPSEVYTKETYLGFQHSPLHSSGPAPNRPGPVTYQYPATVEPNTFALSGMWDAAQQSITAGPGAELKLNYDAKKVHLVAGGQGTLTTRLNGKPISTVPVSGNAPTLYTLVDQPNFQRATITVTPSQGVLAYSFTFD